MSEENETFEAGDSGAADCVPTQAGSIKKGGYCMLKGKPCRVTDYSTAKPGKHGSAKATIVGVDIFTGKKYEDGGPTASTVYVPNVLKTEYELANIENDFTSLILPDGTLKEDIKLPADEPELVDEIKKAFEAGDKEVLVTVISACGQEKVVAVRTK